MKYLSTRNINLEYNASQAILKGLSDDKGLFILNNPGQPLQIQR